MTDAGAASGRKDTGHAADSALAVFVGGAAFLAVVGPKVLIVTNMLWLAAVADSYTHYLGWEFFRRSPWTWPPGLNPDYGLELSSSIIFSDSVPLVALPLKLFSALMPAVFQYTGWWTLLCFVLQAYFAARIASLFSRDMVVRLGFAALLVFAPPMLWRLSVHFSLVAHWVVLATIYRFFLPAGRRRWLAWTLLLGIGALVHTYFLAMCAPLWIADMVRQRRSEGAPPWFVELVVVLGVVVGALWVGGFFPLRPTMLSSGYGIYRLNLLSLVNPDGGQRDDHWSWSAILPNLPHDTGDYEGFNYLGAGALIAIALALPLLWINRTAYAGATIWPLFLAALLLAAFAISPNITIADRTIQVPVPHIVFELASSLRSSGRFFWPVFYLLLAAAVWLLHRAFGPRATGPILLALAALQIYDTYPGWSVLRARFEVEGTSRPSSLTDPRLSAVADHYNAVRALPPGTSLRHWDQIADFAWRNHRPTDAAYLARSDEARYAAEASATIGRHEFDSGSLYFLDDSLAPALASSMAPDDEMFRSGDFYVFAPGWHHLGVSTTLPVFRP